MFARPSGLWFAIAKNEYRITINSFAPNSKRYFLPLVFLIVLFYPTVLAPWLLEYFIKTGDIKNFTTALSLMYEILLLNIFMIFLILPISLSIKDIKAGSLELLLSTPMKSSDILVGEFFGRLPFYILGAVLAGGFLTGIFGASGSNPLIVLALTLLLVLNFLIAYWIGTCVGFYMRSLLSKSSRMKDIGKAISFILIIPAVFVMYGTMGLIMTYIRENSFNSTIKDFLMIFPSSWIAFISKEFLTMNNFSDLVSNDFIIYGSLILFLVIIVIIAGMKLGNSIYNLEPASFSESEVQPHNITYKFFKQLGGNGSFGVLLAYNYKNYIRKFENLSKLVYAVTLMFAMIFFFNNMQLDNEFSYIIAQVLSSLLCGFMVSELTIYGKENLLLYRQSPIGEWKFIFSKIIVYTTIILPIVLFFNVLLSFIVTDLTIYSFIRNILAITVVTIALICLSVGIFLLNPPFNDKAPEFMLNFQAIIFGSVFLFIILLISGLVIVKPVMHGSQFIMTQLIHAIIICLSGLILLVLGKKKLESLE